MDKHDPIVCAHRNHHEMLKGVNIVTYHFLHGVLPLRDTTVLLPQLLYHSIFSIGKQMKNKHHVSTTFHLDNKGSLFLLYFSLLL
jgi:hypothetical protein